MKRWISVHCYEGTYLLTALAQQSEVDLGLGHQKTPLFLVIHIFFYWICNTFLFFLLSFLIRTFEVRSDLFGLRNTNVIWGVPPIDCLQIVQCSTKEDCNPPPSSTWSCYRFAIIVGSDLQALCSYIEPATHFSFSRPQEISIFFAFRH